ncbi:hypothetical protein [Alloactinosynnema sp. L-07]|uniref:hypothetical protein n=1 Tax=Alloactinosynnema sp. L-07 TaxID=1653480 RepID=UPI0006B576F9|nr:hypothetical protein [Alloactinosynnema sp. L-07]
MPSFAQRIDVANELSKELIAADFGPYYATPCGVLSPLHRTLDERAGVLTVAREDNAVGIAVGASLTGRHPVVLMENAGLGMSLSAIASLVVPYRIPMLFVVNVRVVAGEHLGESAILRRLTVPLLVGLGMETFELDLEGAFDEQVNLMVEAVQDQRRPAALLIADRVGDEK